MSENWCTIESDPGVFTELIENFGVRGVQVEELYSLDDELAFAQLGPVYGMIFLFKWQGERDDRPVQQYLSEPDLFFANQVISNACATQAILSILLNTKTKDVDLGDTLTEFKNFTAQFPPELKGLSISNSEIIRTVHNSFARQEPFVVEETKATEKDDVYHFIAYLPFNGKVYELDGLKGGPILLGEGEDWLSIARPAIQSRIERYASSEIRFNLMALIKNRKQGAQEAIARHERHLTLIQGAIGALTSGGSFPKPTAATDAEDPFIVGTTLDHLTAQQSEEQLAIDDLKRVIADEETKFRRWKEENIRRKHNYIPFVMTLLKVLAERGTLKGMVESAKKKANEQQEARKKATVAAK